MSSIDTGDFSQVFGEDPSNVVYDISAGGDGVIPEPDVAPIAPGTDQWLDGWLTQGASVTSPGNSQYSAPVGPFLPQGSTQPAPVAGSAGSGGSSLEKLLGFGAPFVNSLGLAKSTGILKNTAAPGASVGQRLFSNTPLRTLFDTTNQGVTGQHLIFGGVALVGLLYVISRLK